MVRLTADLAVTVLNATWHEQPDTTWHTRGQRVLHMLGV